MLVKTLLMYRTLLKKVIVDAQNQLERGIFDAQNALENHTVGAQNAKGELTVDNRNYIMLQHNKLSQWLYEKLSIIFDNIGGKSKTFMGSLKEHQPVVPVQLHWTEDQPTVFERLEQIQKNLLIQ